MSDTNNIDIKTPTAVKAELKDAYTKMLIWGSPGSGKSRLALTSPNPLVIDLEGSTSLYANEFDFFIAKIDLTNENINNNFKLTSTICNEVKQGLYPDRQTLVIDPISDLLDELEWHIAKGYSKLIGRDVLELNALQKTKWYAYRRDQSRKVLDSIKALPLNIVFVARSKILWDTQNGQLKPVGDTIDALPIVESLMDIVIHMENGEATVSKSRAGELPKEKVVPKNFNDLMEVLRGKNIIDK